MPRYPFLALRSATWIVFVALYVTCVSSAFASSQLALDKGCYSCHGTPPKKGAPTMENIAADYAKYLGQTDAAARLSNKLREHHIFSNIPAHERLSEESALILVRWLIEGAK
jgi:cytochrome c